MGFLFGFIGYSIWDMERKRAKIADLVRRLEPFAKGDGRTQLRHIRRLCRSSFFASNLTNRLDDELADIERLNGVSSGDEGRTIMPSSRKRISSLENRVQQLEQMHGSSD
jgi:hypothetical protein